MDPDSGKFVPLEEDDEGTIVKKETGEPVPSDWPVFTIGEEITLRGHVFRVDTIGNDKLLLESIRSLKRTKTQKNQERRKRSKQKKKKRK